MPRISVCVPTYNGQAFLAECLESIIAQTVSDVEILIVDDCSSDETVAIASEFAARDARVKVVRNPKNLGLVGNWNRCVDLAKGEWIKFAFQDDLLAPSCLEKMLAAAESGKLMIACDRDFIFDDGTPASDREFFEWHRSFVNDRFAHNTIMSPTDFSRETAAYPGVNLLGEPTTVMLHRSVFPKFGLFNPFLIQAVDTEFWSRVGTNAGVVFLAERLATFRVHRNSTSTLNAERRLARKYADVVLIRHELAYNPVYNELRSEAARLTPPRNLVRDYWHEAYSTMIESRVRETLLNFADLPSSDTRTLFAAYPRLAKMHTVWTLPSRVERLKRRAAHVFRRMRAATTH